MNVRGPQHVGEKERLKRKLLLDQYLPRGQTEDSVTFRIAKLVMR